MTTAVETRVRDAFALEFPGETFDPARALRHSVNPWEYRTPEEIALYDAYWRLYMWFAFDKGLSQFGTMPNIPAVQAALDILNVEWATIAAIGPRSPPRERSSFSEFLGSVVDGFLDVLEVVRPILISFAVGQLLGATVDIAVPVDAPEVIQVLATQASAAAVQETTGVTAMAGTAEGTPTIWTSVIGGVAQLGQTAIATFGGDGAVAQPVAAAAAPAAGAFTDFIKSPIGIVAVAGIGIGIIALVLR